MWANGTEAVDAQQDEANSTKCHTSRMISISRRKNTIKVGM